MPQPKGATISSGMSLAIATTLLSRATAAVAKLDCPKKCACTGSPPLESALEPSDARPAAKLWSRKRWQYVGFPRRQQTQVPQESNVMPTRSPTATLVTAEPIALTTPAPSCPSTAGSG